MVMPSCFMLLTHVPSSLISCYHGNLWMSGDLLKPVAHAQIHSPGVQLHSGKMLPNDLDSSLANLVGSEYTESLSRYSSLPFFLLFFIWQRCFPPANAMFHFPLFLSDLQFGGTPAKKWVGFRDIWDSATSKRLLSCLSSFISAQSLLWLIISPFLA